MLLDTTGAAAAVFHPAVIAAAVPPPFDKFPKIPRLLREIVITEKLDGTNSSVLIDEWGSIFAGSRTRWITPEKDNYGFAKWVEGNKSELLNLGPGRHHGEWWGQGIQRHYGLKEKRFSLFNVHRWADDAPTVDFEGNPLSRRPVICDVVPVLYRGVLDTLQVAEVLEDLRRRGSRAVPGWMKPEGIICFHTAASVLFKTLLENDDTPKGQLH
jgi:hypothetical protein